MGKVIKPSLDMVGVTGSIPVAPTNFSFFDGVFRNLAGADRLKDPRGSIANSGRRRRSAAQVDRSVFPLHADADGALAVAIHLALGADVAGHVDVDRNAAVLRPAAGLHADADAPVDGA
jgi:hypothetical protein